FGGFVGVGQSAPVVGRGVFGAAAVGGDQLTDKLVVGLVGGDAVAQPAVEAPSSLIAQVFELDLEQIAPLHGPEIGILRSCQKGVDHVGALVGTLVGEEGTLLLGRRRQADHIVIDAPQKLRLAAQLGRQNLRLLELLENVLVNVVVFRGIAPDEIGIVFEDD